MILNLVGMFIGIGNRLKNSNRIRGLHMFNKDEIYSICSQYDIDCIDIGDLIDTTKNDDDRRFNYKINNQYFLKINNEKAIHNTFRQTKSGSF